MHKCYRYVLFLFLFLFLFILKSYSIDKEKKIQAILVQSKSYEDIEPIINIIKKYPSIYNFLPIGKPIKDNYRISSNFGNRYHPIDKKNKFHSGVDLATDYATKIIATGEGTVVFAGYRGGYGKCVIIDHLYNYQTIYAHMTLYYTKKNKKIKKGQVIGFVGSTGKSTGNHLHYEIKKDNKPINPIQWMK